MKLYTEQQMRDAIKMARNGARSEDNIIGSLNFIKQHSEVTMSINKQSSSIEWYIIERHNIEIQSRLGLISLTQYDEQLIKIEEQAEAMNKEQHRQTANVVRQAIFDLNYSSFDDYYNETFGGNNEQQ